jgi:hypothetical protein
MMRPVWGILASFCAINTAAFVDRPDLGPSRWLGVVLTQVQVALCIWQYHRPKR